MTDRNLEVASANYVVVTDYSSEWRQCRGETISRAGVLCLGSQHYTP